MSGAPGAWPPDLAFLFRRDLDRLRAEVEAYPDDETLWRVGGALPNAGGTLAVHLAGNLRHFVGAVLGGDGFRRDRQREFAVRGLSRRDVAAEVAEAAMVVNRVLTGLDAAGLRAPWPGPTPLGEDTTTGGMLAHLYGHLNYHLGQVNYHRRGAGPPRGETSEG